MIYLLTAIGLTPGGSSTVHIYTQTIHRTTQLTEKSAGRAPSLRVIPWHLPYNWGKSTEKPQHGETSSTGKTSWIFPLNAHVQLNICINSTIFDAQHARSITTYKNTKYKLLETNAALRYNKTCRNSQLTPKYVNIRTKHKYNINGSQNTTKFYLLCRYTN